MSVCAWVGANACGCDGVTCEYARVCGVFVSVCPLLYAMLFLCLPGCPLIVHDVIDTSPEFYKNVSFVPEMK